MRTFELQDATGCMARVRGSSYHAGEVIHIDVTTPTNSQGGYAAGCLWININGAAASLLYVNSGSNTSSTWTNIA